MQIRCGGAIPMPGHGIPGRPKYNRGCAAGMAPDCGRTGRWSTSMRRLSNLAAAALLLGAGLAFQATPARAETTLTVVDGIDVKDWDPAVAYGHESYVLNNIYDPLTRYNTKEA